MIVGTRPARPLVIGLTGNIACGKSTVAQELATLGVEVIDADQVYRELVQPGMPLLAAIRERFGDRIIAPDGGLDRKALGAVVFSDPSSLAVLDDLVRPAVGPEVLGRLSASTSDVVVIDAIKLFESGLAAACDETWVVVCPEDRQVDRLIARSGMDRSDAWRRIHAQAPQADKAARADVVIDNGGSVEETAWQVRTAFARLNSGRNPSLTGAPDVAS